ncbi:hypothetical protein NM96_11360 [Neisseria mucosa]|uniref:virulence factor TspB C-terminal domain-related protein n=1 Tax=Neisseria mucosa TaxID=488 RepID=UPI000D16BD71|nr:hypothetical protein NM96_01765 [Neisseria mucosa]AVR79841.1 hypothetical protein NM96_11360 [Neisseria mucosa]
MKNDTRISVFTGYGKAPNISRLSVCLGSLLVVGQAWADAGLPPPAQHQGAGFPSEQALRQKGYDPKTGVWRVQSQNNGRPTVTKSGDTIKGSQPKTVTVTGNYGEKGTIRTTQTQTVSSSKLQNTINGVWAGGALAASVDKHSGLMGARIRSGDYKGAVESGVLMAGTFGNNLFGGIAESLGNLGRGLGLIDSPSPQDLRQAGERFYQWQMQKEQSGQLGEAVAAAAARKAAEGAAEAAKQQEQWQKAKESQKENGLYPVNVIFREQSPTGKIYYSNKIYYSYLKNFYNNNNGVNQGGSAKIYLRGVQGDYVYYQFKDKNSSTVGVEASSTFKPDPQKTVENMTLNQKDIKDILERMLNNQQTNHAELMNQLSKIGDSVEKSTISNEFTPMTADSAPYTPQGSNTPQQTRFTINRDGSITTTIIPRPDLKPNSTLAPTRSEIIPTPNKGQNTPTTPNSPNTPTTPDSPNVPTTPNIPNTPNNPTGQQNQNQENQKQDFCQQNPNAAQCMPGGDASYEDIVLPENTIDLDFKPLDVFQSDGTCPAPRSVDFGALGQVEFSYDPLCDLARKLRPIFIAICVLTCAYFVYESVKEL